MYEYNDFIDRVKEIANNIPKDRAYEIWLAWKRLNLPMHNVNYLVMHVFKADLINRHTRHKVFGTEEDEYAYYAYCKTCKKKVMVLKYADHK